MLRINGIGSTNRLTISYPTEDEKLYDGIVKVLFNTFKTPEVENIR